MCSAAVAVLSVCTLRPILQLAWMKLVEAKHLLIQQHIGLQGTHGVSTISFSMHGKCRERCAPNKLLRAEKTTAKILRA